MANRLDSLDLIRGVAILGILFMNIMAMAGPMEAYYSPVWRAGLSAWELPLFQLQSLLFESRFMSMFSLLFGVGLYMQYHGALAKNVAHKPRLYSRLRWLLLFGVLHGLLLFMGDILVLYACCGLVVVSLLTSSNRKQLSVALVFLAMGQLVMLALFALVYFKGQPAVLDSLPLSQEALHSLQQQWTSYPDRFQAQLGQFGQMLMFMPLAGIWHNSALMLIGIVLYKQSFFHDRRGLPWGILSLVLGWVLGWLILQMRASIGWDSEAGFASMMLMMLAGMLSAIGYCSLLVALAARTHLWLSWLKQAGRMAFTLYIGQSLVVYLLFVWLLPQYWGALGRPELLSLALLLSVLQLWFADAWLKRYDQGPLERLWRFLAYRQFRSTDKQQP